MNREYIRTEKYENTVQFEIRERYFIDGKLSRDQGPADIWHSAILRSEDYYKNGVLHRTDGPAEILTDLRTGIVVRENYRRHGKMRRYSEGPAVIFRDGNTGDVTRRLYLVAGELVDAPPQPRVPRAKCTSAVTSCDVE